MLALLQIKNFTLIDQLELTFSSGLNVLTGETGAGKSIILDAIDVVLGGKAHSRLIRQGSNQAIIEATWRINLSLQEWLNEQEIDPLEDSTVVVSRELTLFGNSLRSRSRINGVLVNRQQLSQLRTNLVEITAQGQTVQLMNSVIQRELLDLHGGDVLLKQRDRVRSFYEVYQIAQQTLLNRRHSEQQRLQRLDLLLYQLKELEEVGLNDPSELNQLEQEQERLSHVVDLQQSSYQVYQLLYQNDQGECSVTDSLGQAESILLNMANYDRSVEPILAIVRDALNLVVDAGHLVNSYGDQQEADPERLAEVGERITLLKRICRKYGSTLAEVITYYEKLQQEKDELTDQSQTIEELEKNYTEAEIVLKQACEQLTELRQQAATNLEKQLIRELKPLGMDKIIFVCQIMPCSFSATGADMVIFYFSPNPGEKIQPLSETASGGEMSRFLLALKACFSHVQDHSSTLIFDEIDAGVSGKVTQAIADKLYQLSQTHQVLCVTHQPLVAAMADAHFRVGKQIIEELPIFSEDPTVGLSEIRTVVRVTPLNSLQTRRDELAFLTGGHSADEAIAFAESLLMKAAMQRKPQLT
ncbi:DNA repair protein RecN [Aphanothece hegewaldii CCALA 016]|uniref:DNA repair protein RecN n=1 Tax=Aphanothece hegewaldii CCALA 016 TaxID=2107694 RepID=A0A2T1M1G0_9CHRO|nr:DNA repair protein RecN [Aphanothece hegewaldii]PSF38439.1 DNA repair protein RecN [Aphanothece hegewaldii CCALA 016]